MAHPGHVSVHVARELRQLLQEVGTLLLDIEHRSVRPLLNTTRLSVMWLHAVALLWRLHHLPLDDVQHGGERHLSLLGHHKVFPPDSVCVAIRRDRHADDL